MLWQLISARFSVDRLFSRRLVKRTKIIQEMAVAKAIIVLRYWMSRCRGVREIAFSGGEMLLSRLYVVGLFLILQ